MVVHFYIVNTVGRHFVNAGRKLPFRNMEVMFFPHGQKARSRCFMLSYEVRKRSRTSQWKNCLFFRINYVADSPQESNLQPASDIEDQPADLQTPSGICRPFAQWFEAQELERALPPGFWSILKGENPQSSVDPSLSLPM